MKSIEEICDKFNRSEDEVEKDLYSILMEVAKEWKTDITDNSYKHALKLFLAERRCIVEDVIAYEITEEGQRLLSRGWVTKDYKSLKEREKKDTLIKNWTLIAAIITAFATLFTAILTMCHNS